MSFSWNDIFKMTMPVIVCLITFVIGYLFRKVVFLQIRQWAQKTGSKISEIIILSLKAPIIIWFLMLGVYFAAVFTQLPVKLIILVNKILLVLLIFSIAKVIVNISKESSRFFAPKTKIAMPAINLVQNIIKIAVYAIAFLMALNTFGISVAPLLATLGVGGLAVALGLQDTLSNLFAGFHITLTTQIRIGDYIKLSSGEEGYVTDINWRETKIKMLSNNIISIPNAKLNQAIVTNYYLPEKEIAILVDVGVYYGNNLKKVEQVTLETAKEIMKTVPGGVPGFEPVVRYQNMGNYSVNFTVTLRAREFESSQFIKHEFVKKLHERYEKEGIIVPYTVKQ